MKTVRRAVSIILWMVGTLLFYLGCAVFIKLLINPVWEICNDLWLSASWCGHPISISIFDAFRNLHRSTKIFIFVLWLGQAIWLEKESRS